LTERNTLTDDCRSRREGEKGKRVNLPGGVQKKNPGLMDAALKVNVWGKGVCAMRAPLKPNPRAGRWK